MELAGSDDHSRRGGGGMVHTWPSLVKLLNKLIIMIITDVITLLLPRPCSSSSSATGHDLVPTVLSSQDSGPFYKTSTSCPLALTSLTPRSTTTPILLRFCLRCLQICV